MNSLDFLILPQNIWNEEKGAGSMFECTGNSKVQRGCKIGSAFQEPSPREVKATATGLEESYFPNQTEVPGRRTKLEPA